MKYPASLQSRSGWQRLFELKRAQEPHVHQIEPTNHCPYTCSICPRSSKMTRELGFMDFDLYCKIIDEIGGYTSSSRDKEIELFHFGESLLHPKIADMVAYGSTRGLKMVLSVNAPHLTPQRCDALLSAQPHKIILSLDGHDDESYRRIRGKVANYAKATQHIDYLLASAAMINTKTEIVVRMIRIHDNAEHAEAFRSQWERKGASVEIRDFFPWTEAEMVEMGHFEPYPPHMPCPFPWQYLVIQWDGAVVPCCRDYNSENAIGNIADTTLKEIWDGAEYRAFRDRHGNGDLDDSRICTECMSIYYNDGTRS